MATRRGPDGTVRVAIQGLHHNTSWANVFWCNLTGGVGAPQANLDTWTLAFGNAYKTRFAPNTPASVSYVTAKSTLFQAGGTVLESTQAITGVGGNAAAELLDNGASVVLSWLSPVYWRGGKPRTYLPGFMQAYTTDGRIILPAYTGDYLTRANNFRTDVNALVAGAITATQLGFVSFRTGNAERVPPLFYAITGAAVHARIGTQRRRLGAWVQ